MAIYHMDVKNFGRATGGRVTRAGLNARRRELYGLE
jgi:hypothetical protein